LLVDTLDGCACFVNSYRPINHSVRLLLKDNIDYVFSRMITEKW